MKIVKLTMEHVNKGNTDMFDLPKYFEGTEKQCRTEMKRCKFEWRKSENMMGGYWVEQDFDCYYIIP
jgi:hypothetical protein